ncbi:hypothetical protein HY571_00465 [Candidatus Micrarchaeota archaeon]|nr:hypothetical protein [Candidatus Micrarchaeota archaeon]
MKQTKITKVLGKVVNELVDKLTAKEKNQDKVLTLSREFIRECAKAIRHLHTGNPAEAKKIMAALKAKLSELKEVGKDFPRIIDTPLQEYAEIMIFSAVVDKKDLPTNTELGIPVEPYLAGFLDASGEIRRSLQLALKEGNHKEAEYYFQCMNDIYNEMMLLKFSSSLVGNLKRKQDVLRAQLEQARSEMLRAR